MPNDELIEQPKVDTLDFLNDDLEDQQDKSVPIQEDQKEEEESEELELNEEESEKEETPEDLEFIVPFKKSDVAKAYPGIFKKFPDMERKIYKGEKYEEVFPTIKDATEARERLEVLERAEASLFLGDLTDIFKAVKSEDEESFKRIADNVLGSIEKVDRSAYIHLIGNIGKFFIQNIVNEANRHPKDSEPQKNLMLGALVLNQYLFGSSQWTPPARLSKEITEDDKKLQEKEKEFLQQRFSEVQMDLVERTTSIVVNTIQKYIDPKETMSAYVRAKAVEDCKQLLDKQIQADESFKNKLDHLWSGVIESNFSKEAQEQVKNAYLGKVKSLLAEVIKKVRNEALSGSSVAIQKKKKEPEKFSDPGKTAPVKRGNDDGPRRGESTKAFLDRVLG